MSNVSEIIREELEKFNQEIKDTITSKGISTTGNAADSLRVEIDEQNYHGRSIGADYIEVLDKGRPPGKFPPVDVIEEWVKNKPVDTNPFLVGRKISTEGTEIYKDKTKGLEIDNKIIELRKRLKDRLPKGAKADVLKELNKFKIKN